MKPLWLVGYKVDNVKYWIARSEHGLMVQILAGLITYLLLAIYCHEQHNEPEITVSNKDLTLLRCSYHNKLKLFISIIKQRRVPTYWDNIPAI